MKVLISVLAALAFFLAVTPVPVYCQEHSRKDVQNLIVKVQKKLDEVKSSQEAEFIQGIIIKIEDHINSAQSLLKDRKTEQAYFEISIGAIYFIMVDATIEKVKADIHLEDVKKKINQ